MKIGGSFRTFFWAILLILFCLCVPFRTAAQSDVELESLVVDIWPEYDQPSVLVIYHITLASSTSLPAEMTLRLPSAAGAPHAVAYQDPTGLYTMNYETNTVGEWQEITFTAPVPDIRIEYYDPSLQKDGNKRTYVYTWPGDYTVNNFSLQVQQPPSAANMVISPDMGSGRVAEDGLTYYTYMVGKVVAGTTFDLSITYEKNNDDLTSTGQFQPVTPSQPVSESTAGGFSPAQVLPVALGIFGLVLIAVGVIWYTRTGRAPANAPSRRRHPSGKVEEEEQRTDGIFCHQCGKKAAASDAFCRACGTKLK